MDLIKDESIFERYESNIRSYCRTLPSKFVRAKDEYIWDSNDRRYLDALSGSGSLNYGHNNDKIKALLLEYINSDGVVQSLDFYTLEKERFIQALQELLLKPKGYNYKVQFCSPCGMAAVEAAIKLARFVTGRKNILYFSNSFHGMSLGTLAISDIQKRRDTAGACLMDGVRANFCSLNEDAAIRFQEFGYTLDQLIVEEKKPAAVIIEVVQGEGGMNAVNPEWLSMIANLCRAEDILLIVDDIQSGCGRTGSFFGFSDFNIYPDIVCVSKSISGFGIPFAFIMLDRKIDCQPVGHNAGTFRGNNLAFLAGRAMIETYWCNSEYEREFRTKAEIIRVRMQAILENSEADAILSGKGMMIGIQFENADDALALQHGFVERNIIIERCGPTSQTVKAMLPLTIREEAIDDFIATFESVLLKMNNSSKEVDSNHGLQTNIELA